MVNSCKKATCPENKNLNDQAKMRHLTLVEVSGNCAEKKKVVTAAIGTQSHAVLLMGPIVYCTMLVLG